MTVHTPERERVVKRARFHTLTVSRIRPLTAESVEVTFRVPSELAADYDYLPGQHVALRATIAGHERRRSYSICRAPVPGELSIAIKRDFGGVFSSWANTELTVGQEIDVMSPQGTFTTGLEEVAGRHFVAIAAGSGITPVISLATSILARAEDSRFTLVYTNRTALDVMFLDELADLKDRYPARLALHHVFSREQRSAALLSGRIDEARLRRMLETIIPPGDVDRWFLCGPFALVQLCRDTLADVGVAAERIRFELFTTDEPERFAGDVGRPVRVHPGEDTVLIEFTLDGQTASVTSPANASETVLNAALRIRPDVPFACTGGVCGTCRARLTSGNVQMTENWVLEPEELERGYILTCQSHPTSPKVTITYDV
ncbi:MAG: 1,2-phenylacetyl-CoA epoxidase subunit PaaE [Microbacteriaceae bacterium]